MSRKTEQIEFRRRKFEEEHGDEYDSFEDMLEDFKNKYNNSLVDAKSDFMYSEKIEALELLEKVDEEEDYLTQIELLKKAQKLDPENIDIIKELIIREDYLLLGIEKLENLEKEYFNKNYRAIKDGQYLDVENRPYFRLKETLIRLFIKEHIYDDAEKHCKDVLKYNESDDLGIRYYQMEIYVRTGNFKKARNFFKSDYSHREDSQMLLYMITSLILERDMTYAKKLIAELLQLNEYLPQYFYELEFNSYNMEDYLENYDFESYEDQALLLGFYSILDIYEDSKFLYINFRNMLMEIMNEDLEKYQDELNEFENEEDLVNQLLVSIMASFKEFKNIKQNYLQILVENDLKEAKDFKKITKQELLEIKGIGKGVLKKLEENGVKFKNK